MSASDRSEQTLFAHTGYAYHNDDSDQSALRAILDHCSLFALTTGLKIFEVGSGTGGLAVRACEAIPDAQFVGCDIDGAALQVAATRIEAAQSLSGVAVSSRITLHHASCADLLEAHFGRKFDVVVLKDVYYLLSESERRALTSTVRSLLNIGGLVLLIDPFPSDQIDNRIRDVVSKDQVSASIFDLETISVESLESWIRQAFGVSAIPITAIRRPQSAGVPTRVEAVIRYEELLPKHQFNAADFVFQLSKSFGTLFLDGYAYGAVFGSLNLFVARSGGGKTTFLKGLQGDLRGYMSKQRRAAQTRLFSMPQDPDIFVSLSPVQNVRAFGGGVDEAKRTLRDLGLNDSFFERRDCEGISGGERQRLVLAQALTAAPKLLLLDEPSRGLDRARRLLLFEALMASRKDKDQVSMTIACTDHDIKRPTSYLILFSNLSVVAKYSFGRRKICKPLSRLNELIKLSAS